MRYPPAAAGPHRAAAGILAAAAVALALLRSVQAMGAEAPQPPRRLADTGLYGADGLIAPGVMPYSPQYPLWTDGAEKVRWISLPAGARIDATDPDAWRLPVGTKLWKEFAWGGRKVETRLMWHAGPEGWIYAAYVWNEAQDDAVLAPDAGVPDAYEFAAGRRHSVPGTADCRVCHDAAPSPALGFSALQLSDDRDPLAPHAEPLRTGDLTLRALADAGRFEPARPAFVDQAPRIRSDDPVERAALGYLSANCGGCHNDTGPLARLDLDLLHHVAAGPGGPEPAVATAWNAEGRWVVPGVDPDSSRVVAPGAPERSTLLARMASRSPAAQMPPLGSVVPDDEAVALVRRWILEKGEVKR